MSNPFKVGDKVRCIEGVPSILTEGNTYIIEEAGYPFVTIINDRGHIENDLSADRFRLIEEEPGCYIVVARRDSSGSSSGGGVHGQYETLEEAIIHAQALTMCGPSMPYVVFKAVKGFTRGTKEIQV